MSWIIILVFNDPNKIKITVFNSLNITITNYWLFTTTISITYWFDGLYPAGAPGSLSVAVHCKSLCSSLLVFMNCSRSLRLVSVNSCCSFLVTSLWFALLPFVCSSLTLSSFKWSSVSLSCSLLWKPLSFPSDDVYPLIPVPVGCVRRVMF